MGSRPRAEPAWDWARLRRTCLIEARRLLHDPHEAEEAVQEALARAWRQRHRCRDSHAPMAWARQIARNEALRILARKAAARQVELTSELPAEGEGPEEELVQRLTVQAALQRLSPQERELVRLRYVADLGQPEIARRLGMPEATVRVRLHRIRKRLRMLMPDGG